MHPPLAARINNLFSETNDTSLSVFTAQQTLTLGSQAPSSALHVMQMEMQSCSRGKSISL